MKSQTNNQDGFVHLWLIVLAALVVVGGSGAYVYQHNKNANSLSSVSDQSTENLPEALPEDMLAAEKVKELALSEKPGATVSSVELETEEGVVVYRVKLADGSRLMYNAKSGKLITKTLQNQKEEVSQTIPANFTTGITFAKAREIALAQKPGGVIQKIELEKEDGVIVYSVRFSDGARVDVDAATGAVVRNKAANTQKSTSKTTTSKSSSGSSNTSKSSDDNTSTSSNSGSGSSSDSDNDDHSGSGSSGSGSSGSGSGHDESDDD